MNRLTLLLFCGVLACQNGSKQAPAPRDRATALACSTALPLGPPLQAFLSRARAAHHRADLLEEDSAEQAVAALLPMLDTPAELGNPLPVEALEVKADTLARIAELEVQLARFDAAALHVELGLRLVPDVNYYRGRLFEVLGLLEEARHRAAKAKNDQNSARLAKERALAAFEEGMKIQAEVIRRHPPAPTEGAPRSP